MSATSPRPDAAVTRRNPKRAVFAGLASLAAGAGLVGLVFASRTDPAAAEAGSNSGSFEAIAAAADRPRDASERDETQPVATYETETTGTFTAEESGSTTVPSPPLVPAPDASATDAESPALFDPETAVGTWVRNATGTRTLTVRRDGTATMRIDFDWITALVMGPEVTLEIAWRLDGDEVVFETIGGSPEATYRSIIGSYGTVSRRPIIELTADRFVLGPTESDPSEVVWTRPVQPEAE